MKHLVLFSLALVAMIATLAQPCSILNFIYTINIINDLPAPNSTMKVHCKSDGHDLGRYTLNSTQDRYSWIVCVNSFGAAPDADCLLIWESSSKQVEFPTLNEYIRHRYCQYYECYWSARADGIHSLGLGLHENDIMVEWQPLQFGAEPPFPDGVSSGKDMMEHNLVAGFIYVAIAVLVFIVFIIAIWISIRLFEYYYLEEAEMVTVE